MSQSKLHVGVEVSLRKEDSSPLAASAFAAVCLQGTNSYDGVDDDELRLS